MKLKTLLSLSASLLVSSNLNAQQMPNILEGDNYARGSAQVIQITSPAQGAEILTSESISVEGSCFYIPIPDLNPEITVDLLQGGDQLIDSKVIDCQPGDYFSTSMNPSSAEEGLAIFRAQTQFGDLTEISVNLVSEAQGSPYPSDTLQLDINSLDVEIGFPRNPNFNENYTGSIYLNSNENTNLAAVLVNGDTQGLTQGVSSLAGVIAFEDGAVILGYLEVTFDDGSFFSAEMPALEGRINIQVGQGYSSDGLFSAPSFENLVNGSHLAGINVSQWQQLTEEIAGSFLLHSFDPNINQATPGDLDLFIKIPRPMLCQLDSNDNGIVGSGDLAQVLSAWGQNIPTLDFNRDGQVGSSDLAAVLSGWGQACSYQ